MSETQTTQLTKKDFVSDQAVRWCPGCGDYAILAQAQKQMPTFGRKKKILYLFQGLGAQVDSLITWIHMVFILYMEEHLQ